MDKEFDDLKAYVDTLDPEARAYAIQFYDEYYNRGLESDRHTTPILNNEGELKEARKRNDNLYEDAFTASAAKRKQVELTPDQIDVLEAASDEMEWRDALVVGGKKLAIDHIFNQAIRDLDNTEIDPKTTLARFYIKMCAFTKTVRKERYEKKKA